MKLIAFHPIVRNTLRGFATVELSNGLEIADCPVHINNGRAWVSLPAKPVIDRDGRQVVSNGKPQYVAIVCWCSRDLADRFSDALVALVRAEYPEALS